MSSQHSQHHNYHCCQDCVSFNLRKATRAVSQFYDSALRPVGIRGTQFSLLSALTLAGEVLITQLAEYIVMDRTTLTRNLEVMEKDGLVAISPGEDKRTRLVIITPQGQQVLEQAFPLWQQAQGELTQVMAGNKLLALMDSLRALIKATQGG